MSASRGTEVDHHALLLEIEVEEMAVQAFRDLALERPATYQHTLVRTLRNLGALRRSANQLEAARDSNLEALPIIRELAAKRPEVYLSEAAIVLNELGSLQHELGELKAAETSYLDAQKIYRELVSNRREVYLPEVAMVLSNLGLLQHHFNEFEAARASFTEALSFIRELAAKQPEVYRLRVAMVLSNLGNLQQDLNELEAARSSELEALQIYRELALKQPEIYRSYVAKALNNQGNLQHDLNELEAAKASKLEALQIYRELASERPEIYRPDVAMVLNNLGSLQHDLNELEAAKANKLAALQICRELASKRPEIYRPNVAMVLNNLGNLQDDLNDLEAAKASKLEALRIYRELAFKRPKAYRPDVAMVLGNLGILQKRLHQLEAAKASYAESLMIYRELALKQPGVYRPEIARTLNNFGILQKTLNEIRAAEVSYAEALEIYESYPDIVTLKEQITTRVNIAELFLEGDFCPGLPERRRAYESLALACRLTEKFRGRFHNEKDRNRVLREASRSFELHMQNCIALWLTGCRDGQPDTSVLAEALWAAEASRSRQLLDRLSLAELTPARLSSEVKAKLEELDRQLEQARRRLEQIYGRGESDPDGSFPTKLMMSGDRGGARRQLEELEKREREVVVKIEREKVALIAQLRKNDPDEVPEPMVEAQDFGRIQALIPTDVPTAFVEYSLGREQSFAFLAFADGQVVPIQLPALRSSEAQALSETWSSGYARAKRRFVRAAKTEDQGERWEAFGNFVRDWQEVQRKVLQQLQDVAVAPIVKALSKFSVKRLVISPHQALHIFPLHACRLEDGRLFGDVFEISYTPSFFLLYRCTERRREGEPRLVLIDDPTRGDLQRQLNFSEAESMAIATQLKGEMQLTHLPGSEATRQSVTAHAESARVLHYSGHAGFNSKDPLKSKLVLHGRALTLGDVFSRVILRNNALTVLNGCESGLLKPDVIDDYHSFTTGFLFAGAPCVITTLWTVPDLPSALIMDEFYARWAQGEAPAAALRTAQEKVRRIRAGVELDEAVNRLTAGLSNAKASARKRDSRKYARLFGESDTPFADPVHWAAFTCNGLGYRRLE